MGRAGNAVIREKCDVKEDVVNKIEKIMLTGFAHGWKEIDKRDFDSNTVREKLKRMFLDQWFKKMEQVQVRSTWNHI
jgi:hypothetical protein